MKVSDAIRLLVDVQKKHGDVEVYFDCPNCEYSFAPALVKALSMHMTGTWKPAPKARQAGAR